MAEIKTIGIFEKYLSIWVIACIVIGIGIGNIFNQYVQIINTWNVDSINIPIAVLIWLMIFPMMLQIDLSSIKNLSDNWKGLGLTLTINWLIKPFTMALISYFFFYVVFSSILEPVNAQQYLAGAILLGAAPCTAMVFVWSYLSEGNANFTLLQVTINDLILLFLFIPIVAFLFSAFGISFLNEAGQEISMPYNILFSSVLIFILVPMVLGVTVNRYLISKKGKKWFSDVFLRKLKPVSILALLSTLILIFAFQGNTIINNPFHIVLIAIPLAIQTYVIFFISWKTARQLKLPYDIASPASMIGASNFFELAVAVAIALFGINSGAALATVVGVLIEVPIMLSLVKYAVRYRY